MSSKTNSITVQIENLRIWNHGNWVKCSENSSKSLLKIHYDQLLIISDDKVLESLNSYKKLKGIFKDDVLILIINADGQEIRKIKFQIRDNVLRCLHELKIRFPVVSYGSVLTKTKTTTKYHDVEGALKHVLEGKSKVNTSPMPAEYNNFVKLCLLDPMFPQLVHQTKEILDKQYNN